MTISDGYEIKSASNGGFIVASVRSNSGCIPEILGAFSNAADMITWLAKGYGLNSHPTPIPAGGTNISVSIPLVGEKPSESITTERVRKIVIEAIHDHERTRR